MKKILTDLFEGVPIIWVIVIAIVIIFALWLLGAAFFQLAWNHGVTHAFGAHAISFATAFWLWLGVSAIGNAFKPNSSFNSSD